MSRTFLEQVAGLLHFGVFCSISKLEGMRIIFGIQISDLMISLVLDDLCLLVSACVALSREYLHMRIRDKKKVMLVSWELFDHVYQPISNTMSRIYVGIIPGSSAPHPQCPNLQPPFSVAAPNPQNAIVRFLPRPHP